MSQPLAGIVVVDLSRHLPGPLVARLLSDLGARVIKIEEPEMGDPVRTAPPFRGGRSALASILLSGVESVALDLKRDGAREVLAALLERADVLLASFRPGGLDRFGFGPEAVRERFPRLVVCSLTGWGEDGPHAKRMGHDLTYQAIAGLLAPTAAMPSAPFADLTGAWSAVSSVLATLYRREREGLGGWIDASLFDAAVHSNIVAWAAEAGKRQLVGDRHALAGGVPCYGLYRTADGLVLAVAALEAPAWRRFCEIAGRPELVKAQFSRRRKAHHRVAEMVFARPAAEWRQLLAAEDLPIEIVLSPSEARRHPQFLARHLVRDDSLGLPRLGFPARLDGKRPWGKTAVPSLGEHTTSVLTEHGLPVPKRTERREGGVGRRFSWKRLLFGLMARVRKRSV